MTNENKKRILVADDDRATLDSIVAELRIEGFVVYDARDGEEAFQKALSEKPDLILLDILMPKMSGLEVIRKLRDDAWGKRVPVIFISNLSADDIIIKEIIDTEPMYYIMKKDWSIDDLLSKIKNIFEVN